MYLKRFVRFLRNFTNLFCIKKIYKKKEKLHVYKYKLIYNRI